MSLATSSQLVSLFRLYDIFAKYRQLLATVSQTVSPGALLDKLLK